MKTKTGNLVKITKAMALKALTKFSWRKKPSEGWKKKRALHVTLSGFQRFGRLAFRLSRLSLRP